MANINITTTELLSLLDITPADQNLMLVGNHGIGKSEILTEYFSGKGMKVVPLFLGQMSDPGDLIGIPNRNTTTGKTEFMPPYWFPLDGQPIVLFLDELNRTLAGRKLPEGSRIISAVNSGDQYQLTDLDPALVSRFNVVTFRPTTQEWLLWADKAGVDARVKDFIRENPQVLMRDIAYTNDPRVIARNPGMVSINSAIEIDLSGQVCSDSIGSRIFSGSGGQLDFILGATYSQGGIPTIAMPSMTAKGRSKF